MQRAATTLFFILFVALPCFAQAPADLFDDEALQEIRLDVHPHDWDRLKANFLENTYYVADMRWLYKGKYIEAPQVGIRSRGTGSRNPVKPGLRVDINRYNSGQRFLGLRELTLRNNTQDATMLRERMAFALMRRMGLPAPRTAHTRLYVNNEYLGLYLIVESVNEDYLQDRFNDAGGYVYDYDYGFTDLPYFFEYRGEDPRSYSPKPFQPETHEDRPQIDRIVSFVRTINLTSDQEFEFAISEFIDLKAFATELAAEGYLAELDGIIGDYGLNNFYLYRQSTSNRFIFIPWDKSETMKAIDRPSKMNLDTNRLARRALAIPAIDEKFRGSLALAASIAGGTGGWLEHEILRAYNQVADAARQDPYKQCTSPVTGAYGLCSNADFETAVADLILFARGRYVRIQRELADGASPNLPTGDQTINVPDGGVTVYTTSAAATSSVKTAHGYVEASTGNPIPSALAILGFRKNGMLITETAFSASLPLRSGRIHAEIGGGVNTGIAIANANAKPVIITFYFTDGNGQDFAHGSASVLPGGQIAGFLNDPPFEGPSSLLGTFTFTASLPVGALALRGLTNERSEFLIAAMPVGDIFATAAPASVIPQFAEGGGWSSEVQLVNMEDAVSEGTVQLQTSTGSQTYPYTLQPRSSAQIRFNNTSTPRDGWVGLSGTGRSPVMAEVLLFRRDGVTESQTVVPAVSERSSLRTFGESDALTQSSLALVNGGTTDAVVQIEATAPNGTPTGFTGAVAVPAKGRVALNLRQIGGFQVLPANFQGVLHISSSVPIHVMSFATRTNERGDIMTTAIPPAEVATSGYLSVPHVVASAGYETRIIVLGTTVGSTAGGVFRYRDGSGELVNLGLR